MRKVMKKKGDHEDEEGQDQEGTPIMPQGHITQFSNKTPAFPKLFLTCPILEACRMNFRS